MTNSVSVLNESHSDYLILIRWSASWAAFQALQNENGVGLVNKKWSAKQRDDSYTVDLSSVANTVKFDWLMIVFITSECVKMQFGSVRVKAMQLKQHKILVANSLIGFTL